MTNELQNAMREVENAASHTIPTISQKRMNTSKQRYLKKGLDTSQKQCKHISKKISKKYLKKSKILYSKRNIPEKNNYISIKICARCSRDAMMPTSAATVAAYVLKFRVRVTVFTCRCPAIGTCRYL